MAVPVRPPTPAEVLAGGIVFIIITTGIVFMRFVSRSLQRHDMGLDDYLMIPALLANITLCATMIWGVSVHAVAYPTPQPPAGMSPLDFESFPIQATKKVVWIVEIVQSVGLTCTKVSLLLLYRRIFYTGRKTAFHWASITLIAICVAWGIAFFVAWLTECNGNLAAWWTTIRTLNNNCPASLQIEAAFAISDTITDIAVFILPFAMVWSLRMSTNKKLALSVVFGVGAMSVAASIVRMIVFTEASLVSLKKDYSKRAAGADDSVPSTGVYWAMIESSLSLIAGCLPTIYKPIKDRANSYYAYRRRLRTEASSQNMHGRKTGSSVSTRKPKPTDVSLIFANQSGAAEIESHALHTFASNEVLRPPINGITVSTKIEQEEEKISIDDIPPQSQSLKSIEHGV